MAKYYKTVQMDNNPKHTSKATFWKEIVLTGQVSHLSTQYGMIFCY